MPTPELRSIGLIVNTYNQPDYLHRVLKAISSQHVLPTEVLIADDGSKSDTAETIADWASATAVSTQHIWQPDDGFRRAQILNKAIVAATADYLVFLDGDTVPHPDFVRDHKAIARKRQFVQGHRCFIGEKAARSFGKQDFLQDRRSALLTRQLSGWRNAFRWPFPWSRVSNQAKKVRGCNLAIWRDDLLAVNGYNEQFVGWGREDSELTLRLLNRGLRRVDVRGWALCYHLWHPPANRDQLPRNDELLAGAAAERSVWCACGLDQYLELARELRRPLASQASATR